MTYIVTEPCIGTKDRACVEVCPVECFYEATDMLYIHPDECIDCAACEPVCPVTAIFPEDSVPDQYASYTEKNYKFDYTNAPHALTKQMLGDQDNLGTTFTVEGKTVTLPPPYGGPAAPPPTVEAAPAPAPAAAAPAPPKVEAVPAAAAPAPAAPAPAAAPVRAVAGDALSQVVEAAAAAAEAAARAAEAAAAAVRILQGKTDGRTVSGAPSAQVVHPQAAPAAKPADVKADPKAEAAAPAQRQAEAPMVAAPDPSFEHAKEVLYALIDFESGVRAADSEELTRAEGTATTLFDEIAKAVGKRDYDLQDLQKKDVALRQKMELANSIVDHVGRTRLHIEVQKQRGQTRKQIPGAVMSFAIAGVCAALGLYYALTYSFSTTGTPSLKDLLTAPFSPEGFMPFLGFNLLGGFFALFGLLALLKLGRSWVETCHLEALRPDEFGAASLRPRRLSWIHRLKIESQRILDTQRMLQALAAKKR
jgi:NAD-dependent dihydropyrimidine dehydrogenase PreA subunit